MSKLTTALDLKARLQAREPELAADFAEGLALYIIAKGRSHEAEGDRFNVWLGGQAQADTLRRTLAHQ